MYVLVDYNQDCNKLFNKLNENNDIPVVLFKIRLNNKNQIRDDYDKLKQLKTKLNPKFSALQITLDKMENATVGIINSFKQDFDILIGLGGLNKVNRFFLEQTRIDFLQDPHNSLFKPKIDFIHHFNSGINHILCNFAKEREIDFLISLNFIDENKRNIIKDFGKINQNLRFTRKYKINNYMNYIVQNENHIKNIKQLNSILSSFDVSNTQISDNQNILMNKIMQNKKVNTREFVNNDIKILN